MADASPYGNELTTRASEDMYAHIHSGNFNPNLGLQFLASIVPEGETDLIGLLLNLNIPEQVTASWVISLGWMPIPSTGPLSQIASSDQDLRLKTGIRKEIAIRMFNRLNGWIERSVRATYKKKYGTDFLENDVIGNGTERGRLDGVIMMYLCNRSVKFHNMADSFGSVGVPGSAPTGKSTDYKIVSDLRALDKMFSISDRAATQRDIDWVLSSLGGAYFLGTFDPVKFIKSVFLAVHFKAITPKQAVAILSDFNRPPKMPLPWRGHSRDIHTALSQFRWKEPTKAPNSVVFAAVEQWIVLEALHRFADPISRNHPDSLAHPGVRR